MWERVRDSLLYPYPARDSSTRAGGKRWRRKVCVAKGSTMGRRRLRISGLVLVALLFGLMSSGWGVDAGPAEDDGVPGQRVPPDPGDPPIAAPPPTIPDLVVTGIEVNQGVQNLANEMPVVAGRRTIVRVYVDDLHDLGAEHVTARLMAQRTHTMTIEGVLLELPFPQNLQPLELVPGNPGGAIDVQPDGSDRAALNESFWFVLPSSWRSDPGVYQITAMVNPNVPADPDAFVLAPPVQETTKVNNSLSVTITLWEADILRVRAVPLELYPGWNPNNEAVIYRCDEEESFYPIAAHSLRFIPAAGMQLSCATDVLGPVGSAGLDQLAALPPVFNMSESGADGCLRVNQRLTWLKSLENLGGGTWHYMGLVHESFGSLCNGWAGASWGGSAWTRMSDSPSADPVPNLSGGRTFAHELGHRVGSSHVLCKGNEGPPNGGVDEAWPYPFPDCRFTAVAASGYYGLDTYYAVWGAEPTVISNGDPNSIIPPAGEVFPLMGYMSPKWTEPFTHCKWLNKLVLTESFSCDPTTIDPAPPEFGELGRSRPAAYGSGAAGLAAAAHLAAAHLAAAQFEGFDAAANAAALNAADELVLVTGSAGVAVMEGEIGQSAVFPSQSLPPHVVADALEHLDFTAAAVANPDGDAILGLGYRLEVQDASGSALYSLPLTTDIGVHEGFPHFAFATALPWGPDADRVVLLFGDNAEIDFLGIVGAPPFVGNVQFDGATVSWEAADPDGDDILATLRLCNREGLCRVLVLDTPLSAWPVPEDLAPLPGDSESFFDVIVSGAGLATASARSAGFALGNTTPEAVILTQDGLSFDVGEGIELIGYGEDAQDGLIDGDDFVIWTSDIDGVIGNGDLFVGPGTLREGVHTLTLEVTDSGGLTGTASIQVGVAAQVPPSHRVMLPEGWSMVGWTGATAVEEAVASITGAFDAVYAFDPASDSFLHFGPTAPAIANTLDEVELGDGLMVLVTDPAGAVWLQPLFVGPRSVELVEGPNLVAWTGPSGTPIEAALAGLEGALLSAFLWNGDAQAYRFFDTRVPASLNTASIVDYGQGLWLIMSGPATWDQPALSEG